MLLATLQRLLLFYSVVIGFSIARLIGRASIPASRQLTLSNPELKLQTVIDLIALGEKGQYDVEDEAILNLVESKLDVKGRTQVENAIKNIQRLQLQLDRSDGRPDFTPDVLASKYYDFISTCLRTGGGAWTATLGPMEYIGLKMQNHVTSADAIRTVDVVKLSESMGKVLIDLPSGNNAIEKAALARLSGGDAQRNIWDLGAIIAYLHFIYLSFNETIFKWTEPFIIIHHNIGLLRTGLSLVRVATRFAILYDQLEGRTLPENGFGLEFKCPPEKILRCPTIPAVEAMLYLDFGFDQIDDSRRHEGVLSVDAGQVKNWASKNMLE